MVNGQIESVGLEDILELYLDYSDYLASSSHFQLGNYVGLHTEKNQKFRSKIIQKKLGSSYSKIFQVTILAPKLAPTKMRSQAFSGVLGHSRAFSGILMRSQHKNDILSTGTAF